MGRLLTAGIGFCAALFLTLGPALALPARPVREYSVRVEQVIPHDPDAYTQGLFFYGDYLYETTGQYGASSLRRTDRESGRVLQLLPLERKYFGEGSCVLDGRIYVLTWQENVCLVYDAASFSLLGTLYHPREGWGLTTDGEELILSDGSDRLYFLDPMTFMEKRSVQVTLQGRPLRYINELEYVDGEVWANVYGEDYLVRIDPESGCVTARVDCRNLLPQRYARNADVLNGIAWDERTGCLYVTGKLWPEMYRISLVEKKTE